jgi:aminopeptidase C
MEMFDDFQMYTSGVYTKSAEAKSRGWHAMSLVGWGTDKQTGVDYWLVQNSWGNGVGDKGYWKIRRGV